MFGLFSKEKLTHEDYSILKTDFHSHLIPGVDDGAKTLQDALELIWQLKELGFEKVITTPHIMMDIYPNTKELILEKLAEVQEAVRKEGWDIKLEAAAEYMLDETLEELIEENQIMTFGNNHVLVEMSFMAPPPRLNDYLFLLQTRGYRPILAHPERYLYFKKDLNKYKDLRTRGCTFQLNLLSLLGYYGKAQQDNGNWLIKEGLIDFVGSDLHNLQQAYLLKKGLKSKPIQKVLDLELENGRL